MTRQTGAGYQGSRPFVYGQASTSTNTLGGSQSPSFSIRGYSPNIGPHGPKQSSPHGYTKHMGITPQCRPTWPETVSPHGYTKHMGITPQSRPTWPDTVSPHGYTKHQTPGYHTPIKAHMAANITVTNN